MQADTQHGAGFSEPAIKCAAILAQILLEDRCGLAGLVLRRGRQLIRAVVLQLGLGFSRARNLRTVSPRNAAATQPCVS